MSGQVPFTPVTAGALAALTPAERQAFAMAAGQVAAGQKPPMMTIATLVETIQRLITGPDGELGAEGAGPLLCRACRDGEGQCIGAPCEHGRHKAGA